MDAPPTPPPMTTARAEVLNSRNTLSAAPLRPHGPPPRARHGEDGAGVPLHAPLRRAAPPPHEWGGSLGACLRGRGRARRRASLRQDPVDEADDDDDGERELVDRNASERAADPDGAGAVEV